MTEQYNELPTTSEFLVSLEETDHDESSDRISTLFPSTSFKIRGDPAGLATNSIFFSRQFVTKTPSGKSVTLVTTLLLETNHSEIGPNRAKTATGRPKTA